MEDFWSIIRGWNSGLGQFIFFFIIFGMFFGTVRTVAYYGAVTIRGWPPAHAVPSDERGISEDEE